MDETKSPHGGKRRRAGRTTELGRSEKMVRVNLSLDETTLRLAAVVGEGNVSKAVRAGIRLAYEKYQRS